VVEPEVLAEVAADAAADSGGVPVDYLGDFLAVLVEAVTAGEPLTAAQLRAYRRLGDRAARRGVALRALLDLYLSAAWRLWRHLPAVGQAARRPQQVVVAGEVMLHAADDVVAALTEGYQLARRSVVRAQESARREFIDDLLTGTPDVGGLLRRAPGFGLDLTGPYAVACVRSDRAVDDASPLLRTLERAIQGSKADAPALLATKDGHLVVVFAAPDAAALSEVLERLGNTLANTRTLGTWQLAVGRPARGADGVVTSYRESRDLLDLAAGLGIHDPVLSGHDLAVYRILLRDREMLTDLVDSTIGPLRTARGGAEPLVDTLLAYYASGGVAARAARDLHLSVRAVTYRLDRVRSLTGLDPDGTTDRLTLHVAALGARLLTGRTALS
jgi:hypothetical protein